MKFEIIKYQTQFTGETWYMIHVDGRYLNGSVSSKLEDVQRKFEIAKQFTKTEKESEEVILTEEV